MKRREFITKSAVGALAMSAVPITLTGCGKKTVGPIAEVKSLNGSPALFVDGAPVPPMLYTGCERVPNPDRIRAGYVQGLGKSGIKVFFVTGEYDWFQPGSFEDFRSKADYILKNAPDALLILRTRLHPPVQWLRDNPDELVRYENGETMKTTWAIHKDYKDIGMYSLSSAKWREDGSKALLKFIDQVEAADFGQRVIGYFLAAGGTSEWYYPGVTAGNGHYAGNSPTFKNTFSRLLRETYSTEAELQKAWNDPEASFADPKIPNLDERLFSRVDGEIMSAWREDPNSVAAIENQSNIGSFLNPDSHRHVADFYRAWNFGTADSVIHFAKVIKKRTNNKKVVGAFYGSWGCCHFQENSRVSGVLRVIDSGVVDFQANPSTYENRQPGGTPAQRSMNDTFRLRNCIYIVEDDTRTHLSSELNRNFTGTYTLAQSIHKMKRDFGRNLAEDRQSWWFDQACDKGWYDDPGLLALMKRQQEVAHKFYKFDRSIHPEIAVIFDEESSWYISHRTLVDLCHVMRTLEVHRIGAPVSYHLHDDLELDNMPDYRLYIFLNDFALSDKERKTIERKIKTDGKTALWIYAAGVINLDRQPRFSIDHITELTGMNVGMDKGPTWPACRLVSDGDGILEGVATNKDYGYFDRDMFGDVANVQPPGPAWNTLLYPCFYGDDPEAEVLARFKTNGKPALFSRDFGDWRSVHACFKAVRSDIMRAVARYAGCHIYTKTDDILFVGRHFVTIHASEDGEKVIRLPRESDPFEIYEQKQYGKGTKEIRFHLKLGETKTFYLNGEI